MQGLLLPAFSFSFLTSNCFLLNEVFIANQLSQFPVASVSGGCDGLICVYMDVFVALPTSLVRRDLPSLNDLWQEHLKRGCDSPREQ